MVVGNLDLIVTGTQILVRVDRNHVEPYLVVQMRSGGAARLAHVPDNLPTRDVLARNDSHGRQMAVNREHIVTVIDGYLSPIAGSHARAGYVPVSRCPNRRTVGG